VPRFRFFDAFAALNPGNNLNQQIEQLEAAIKQNEQLLADMRNALAELRKSQESSTEPSSQTAPSGLGCDTDLDRALRRIYES